MRIVLHGNNILYLTNLVPRSTQDAEKWSGIDYLHMHKILKE